MLTAESMEHNFSFKLTMLHRMAEWLWYIEGGREKRENISMCQTISRLSRRVTGGDTEYPLTVYGPSSTRFKRII